MDILRREIQTLLFIAVATGLWLFILILRTPSAALHTPFPAIPFFVPSNPVITELQLQETVNSSSDGTNSLILQKKLKGHSTIYTVFLKDDKSPAKRNLFTRTEGIAQSLSIPFNAWSPDNTYFFLKETTPKGFNYLVYPAENQNHVSVNLSMLFAKAYPTYSITDVTGWGGYGLLVVNTKTQDGSLQSFWFEVYDSAFIPLSTYFN